MNHEAEDSQAWNLAGYAAQALIARASRAPSVASIKRPEAVKFVADFFAYCDDSRLSLVQAACRMAVSPSLLSQIKHGDRLPGHRTMLAMSKLSGIPFPRPYAGPFADSERK